MTKKNGDHSCEPVTTKWVASGADDESTTIVHTNRDSQCSIKGCLVAHNMNFLVSMSTLCS